MAIYRNVSTTFWTDSKVSDDFEANERYLYLYLFTNPHSNLCGCYEISLKQIAYETALPIKEVQTCINGLETDHNVIRYDHDTKEVVLLNWHKYNWTSSEKFRSSLKAEIDNIKSVSFKNYLLALFNGDELQIADTVSDFVDTVSEARNGENRAVDTLSKNTITVSVTDTVSVSETDADTVSDTDAESVKEIIDYFNESTGKSYTHNGKETVKHIKARLKEGFTVEDFKTVIYKKTKEWVGTDMEKYIRPQTLFGNKFESYLNQSGESIGGNKPNGANELNGFYSMMEDWASDEQAGV